MAFSLRGAVLSFLLVASSLLPMRPQSRAAADDPLVVIVAPVTGLVDISLPMLRRAFMGAPVDYAPGKRLVPLNAPSDSSDRVRFDRVVLGMSPEEVGRFWVDQRVRGKTRPPRTISTPQLAVRVVAALPGAVAYVRRSMIDDAVRVLSIEGKGPDDEENLLNE